MLFLSINARLQWQVHSMSSCHLQNRCQLHNHTADSVPTSGCSVISQQTWNEICIVLAILGICIKFEKLSVVKRSMYIHISRWHSFNFGMLSSLIVNNWCRWHFGRMLRRVWSRWTRSSEPPECLRIPCFAVLAERAAFRLILMNHCRVSCYCSLHLFIPRKLNSSLQLFAGFGARLLDQI